MNRLLATLLCLPLGGCLAVDVNLGSHRGDYAEKVVDGAADAKAKIAMIDVEGVLSSEQSESIFGSKESQVVSFVEKLKLAEADPDVKAVLVRIDSPGGDVTTSDILYHELAAFKARKKVPVVAAFMGIAASGGYYLASAADAIVAHPTSITGSIGVISLHISLAGLLEKIGVKVVALKSGPNKDMGSPFREMTDADRKLLQSLIDQFYGRFVSVVAEGRKGRLSEADVRTLADGRVYTAQEALQAKLVDRVGYLADAVSEVKTRAGIDQAKLVLYSRRPGRIDNAYSSAPSAETFGTGDLEQARKLLGFHCYYLWEPYLLGK
ncbi:MAG TPA: signal peptide peptidase SppA [Planctomycetota bacterium]|nr:signal peptide peptidase SppA [Planctomycetota bacterium]